MKNAANYYKEGKITVEQGQAFLREIEQVCRKHNLSISHEDCHGAFLIEPFDEGTMVWLRVAQYGKYFGE